MNSPGYWSGWSWPVFLMQFVVPMLGFLLVLLIVLGFYVRSQERRRTRRR